LLTSAFARAEADSPDDLRYCLELPSAQQIAKCAGEISAGSKAQTYSKEEVERILSDAQANTPASTSDSSDAPATDGDKPADEPATEKE
jgi:hypothetical protein